MKTFLRRYGYHALLFLCLLSIVLVAADIAQMYEKTQHVGTQSVDALSDVAIQFKMQPENGLDFCFLDDSNQEYALLQRKEDGVPIFRLVSTNHFYKNQLGRFYANGDFTELQNSYVCGEKAGDIFQISPFVYHNSAYENVGVIKGDGSIALDYGIYMVGTIENDVTQNEFILEGNHKKDVDIVFQEICDWAKKEGVTVNILDRKATGMNDIYNVEEKSRSVLSITILLLCSSMVIITFFWTKQYDQMRDAFYLLGMKNAEIKICFDSIKIFTPVCIGAMIFCRRITWNILGYILGLVFVFMMVNILLCLCLNKVRRHRCENNRERTDFRHT